MSRYTFTVENEPDIVRYCEDRAAKLKGSKIGRFEYEINREALGFVLRPLLLEFKIRSWKLSRDGKFSCRVYARFSLFYEKRRGAWIPVASDPEGADLELSDAFRAIWSSEGEQSFVYRAALSYLRHQESRVVRAIASQYAPDASDVYPLGPEAFVKFTSGAGAKVSLWYDPFPTREEELNGLGNRIYVSRLSITNVPLEKLGRIFSILAE